jgi:5-methylcytosine-specific restriction enzyme A
MRLAKRACSTPGCAGLAENGPRCEACKKLQDRVYESRRGSPWRRGYDDVHQRLRIQCFQRDGWRCVDCGWEPDVIREARLYGLPEPPTDVILRELRQRFNRDDVHLHGDHDIPIEQRPDLRLDLDNYRTRCNRCHSAKTMRELKGTH